jgi:hypothetical protein
MVRTGRLRTSDRRTRLLGRGAKQCGEHVPESFTALFTARDGGVPVGSAAGCGPFPTCYRSHKLLGRLRGHGRDLERRQFSPVKTEVISNRLGIPKGYEIRIYLAKFDWHGFDGARPATPDLRPAVRRAGAWWPRLAGALYAHAVPTIVCVVVSCGATDSPLAL